MGGLSPSVLLLDELLLLKTDFLGSGAGGGAARATSSTDTSCTSLQQRRERSQHFSTRTSHRSQGPCEFALTCRCGPGPWCTAAVGRSIAETAQIRCRPSASAARGCHYTLDAGISPFPCCGAERGYIDFLSEPPSCAFFRPRAESGEWCSARGDTSQPRWRDSAAFIIYLNSIA